MVFSESEFDEAIANVQAKLDSLRLRYQEVQTVQSQITELTEKRAAIEAKPESLKKSESLKTELNLLADEIEQLELRLESHLLKWQEPFWQIVRFTGIGVILGWCLKSVFLRG